MTNTTPKCGIDNCAGCPDCWGIRNTPAEDEALGPAPKTTEKRLVDCGLYSTNGTNEDALDAIVQDNLEAVLTDLRDNGRWVARHCKQIDWLPTPASLWSDDFPCDLTFSAADFLASINAWHELWSDDHGISPLRKTLMQSHLAEWAAAVAQAQAFVEAAPEGTDPSYDDDDPTTDYRHPLDDPTHG